jgi:hypothetical protein
MACSTARPRTSSDARVPSLPTAAAAAANAAAAAAAAEVGGAAGAVAAAAGQAANGSSTASGLRTKLAAAKAALRKGLGSKPAALPVTGQMLNFSKGPNGKFTQLNKYFNSQPINAQVTANKLKSGAKKGILGKWNYTGGTRGPSSTANFWVAYNIKNKAFQNKLATGNFASYIASGRNATNNIIKYPKYKEFLTLAGGLKNLNAERNKLLQKKLGPGKNNIGIANDQIKLEEFEKSINNLKGKYAEYTGFKPATNSISLLVAKKRNTVSRRSANANRTVFKGFANKGPAEYRLAKRNAVSNRKVYGTDPEFKKFWNAYNTSEAAIKLEEAKARAVAAANKASAVNISVANATTAAANAARAATEARAHFNKTNRSTVLKSVRDAANAASKRAQASLTAAQKRETTQVAAKAAAAKNKAEKQAAALKKINGTFVSLKKAVNNRKINDTENSLTKLNASVKAAKAAIAQAAGGVNLNNTQKKVIEIQALEKSIATRRGVIELIKDINALKLENVNKNNIGAMVAEIKRATAAMNTAGAKKEALGIRTENLPQETRTKLGNFATQIANLEAAAKAKAESEIKAIKTELSTTFAASNAILINKTKTKEAALAAANAAANALLKAQRVPQRSIYREAGAEMNMSPYVTRVGELKAKAANFNKFRIIGLRGTVTNWSGPAQTYVKAHKNAAGKTQEQINRKHAKGMFGYKNKNLSAFWKAVNDIRKLETKRVAVALPQPSALSGGSSRAVGLSGVASIPPPPPAPPASGAASPKGKP